VRRVWSNSLNLHLAPSAPTRRPGVQTRVFWYLCLRTTQGGSAAKLQANLMSLSVRRAGSNFLNLHLAPSAPARYPGVLTRIFWCVRLKTIERGPATKLQANLTSLSVRRVSSNSLNVSTWLLASSAIPRHSIPDLLVSPSRNSSDSPPAKLYANPTSPSVRRVGSNSLKKPRLHS
jgi:hypothetical protein